MSGPRVERTGDTWALTWPEEQVGLGLERLQESRDGIHAEVTVESVRVERPGRLLGPVRLNILSAESQTRFANTLDKRVNGIAWHGLIVQACAIVAKQYRAPSPTVRLAELADEGPFTYLVPGLVPDEETTLLYGDGEAGKSLLALRIALSCATGLPLPWGEPPRRATPVLILDWETNARTVRGRLARLVAGMSGLDSVPANVHYRGATRGGGLLRTLAEEVGAIRVTIEQLGIGLVLVDSIGFAVDGPLVEDQTARAALAALRQLHPATRLVVAHVSNASANEQTRRVRPFGSAFFWNGMRSGIEVRRGEDPPGQDVVEVGVYHRKANDGDRHADIGLAVRFDGRDGPITIRPADLQAVPDLAARTPLSSRLRQLLRRGDADVMALAEALDEKPDTVARTLRRMADAIRTDQGTGGRGNLGWWGLAHDA